MIIVICFFMIFVGKFVLICLFFFDNILKFCIILVYKEDFKYEKKIGIFYKYLL